MFLDSKGRLHQDCSTLCINVEWRAGFYARLVAVVLPRLGRAPFVCGKCCVRMNRDNLLVASSACFLCSKTRYYSAFKYEVPRYSSGAFRFCSMFNVKYLVVLRNVYTGDVGNSLNGFPISLVQHTQSRKIFQ